ncbi:hypothetical protein PVK63_06455 [Aliivibrio sp. S2TY2]|uniref:hypothetical protein n=1 Tax=unclassified Aliivibrio TaxID=2645654 RepID=UPI00237884F0|nr:MULTISPECIES: hypothetical protein [unclassified Aliivibrio]MDD9174512.1 hypothetical protein [Aliivibrio sp. S3TY1]MDD9191590.1 hypothetical protein [Aliivibrio sp. S2TY2]
MIKIPAEMLCCYLNELAEKDPDFIQEVLLHKVYCNELIAEFSRVTCGEVGDGYVSSALGLLNALVDKPICINGNGQLQLYVAE